MMWTGSLGRRKSSVSSPPPPSRDSPAQPFFASTLAESPVVVGQPTFAEPGTYAYPSATDRERDRDARTQSPGAGPSRGAQAVDGPGGASIPFPRTPTSPTLPSSPEMSPAATTAADQKASRRRSRSRKWSSISVLRGRELERVDEGGLPFFGRGGAGGSAVQGMVVRDYATLSPGPDTQVPEPPAPTEEGHPSGSGAREREFKLMSEPMAEAQARLRPSTIDSAQLGASAPSRLVIDPARLPPARAHDAYLSRIIRPLDARPSAPTQPPSPSTPPDGARPVLVRHSSAPGVAQSGALLPAFETEEAGPSGQSGARGGRQPIFQIYKAELRDGSDRIVRELRGHLEEVLALQREIGRMHLALEGLDLGDGAPGEAGAAKEEADKGAREEKHAGPPGAMKDGTDPTSKGASATGLEEASSGLERREKAMDAIMAKLDKLSEGLRTYNALGTPRLAFTHDTDRSPATPMNVAGNPVAGPSRPGHPTAISTNSIHVDAHAAARPHTALHGDGQAGKPETPKHVEHRQSPLRYGFARSSTAEDGLSSTSSGREAPTFRRGNSALSPVSPA